MTYFKDGVLSGFITIFTGFATEIINNVIEIVIIAIITSVIVPLIRLYGSKLKNRLNDLGFNNKEIGEVVETITDFDYIKDPKIKEILIKHFGKETTSSIELITKYKRYIFLSHMLDEMYGLNPQNDVEEMMFTDPYYIEVCELSKELEIHKLFKELKS